MTIHLATHAHPDFPWGPLLVGGGIGTAVMVAVMVMMDRWGR